MFTNLKLIFYSKIEQYWLDHNAFIDKRTSEII